MNNRIYLDYNATTPVISEVYDAIGSIIQSTGNPSSIHTEGRAARAKLRKARGQVAKLVGADEDQVIFTSNGTEANNLALSPLILKDDAGTVSQGLLFVGATEHVSVLKGGRFDFEKMSVISVDKAGLITPAHLSDFLEKQGFVKNSGLALEDNLTPQTENFMVSIMFANNETGCIQDIGALGKIVHDFGGLFHVDAVQALGKIKLDFASLPVDFMSISAHKMGGIQGGGALIARNPDRILKDVLMRGGGQEKNRRGGTESLPALVSFGLAATVCLKQQERENERLSQLTQYLEQGLKQINETVEIASKQATRLTNTVCFLSKGLRAENMLMVFDLANIAVSSGSACSSGRVNLSHVLKAMGYSDDFCGSAIRVSIGWDTKKQDIDAFLTVYADIMKRHEKYKKAA